MFDDIRTRRIDPEGVLAVVVFVALVFFWVMLFIPWGYELLILAALFVFAAAVMLAWRFLRPKLSAWVRSSQRHQSEAPAEIDQSPLTEITPDLKSHPGIFIGKTTVAGDLPGLLMVLFFISAAIYILVPREVAGVLLGVYLAAAPVAVALFVISERRDRKRAAQSLAQLHSIGDAPPEDGHALAAGRSQPIDNQPGDLKDPPARDA